MMLSRYQMVIGATAAIITLVAATASGFEMPAAGTVPQPHSMYVVSDLHMGVGRAGGKEWHPMEDFRWPTALEGLLHRIALDHPEGAQLVIAGDFLELWQHPTVSCTTVQDAECGCTLEEMKRIMSDVLIAHQTELDSIGAFLANANNEVLVVPGNHDAALTDEAIWNMLLQEIPQGRDRFMRIRGGVYLSPDGRIAIEHGHLQQFDVNYFPDWPNGVVKQCGTERRFFRPWGENFVQAIFNEVEVQYPLIDNIVPDSEGAALYLRNSGQEGKTWADIARFMEFNLLQTSFYQKIQALDLSKANTHLTQKDVAQCRTCLRENLFLIGNPTEEAVLKRGGEDAKNLRDALRARAVRLSDDSARMLCERAVLLNGGKLALNSWGSDNPSCEISLSTAAERILDPDGSIALRRRVSDIYNASDGRLALYVFGHTHEARLRMAVEMPDGLQIAAYNTGGFQRLMDRRYFDSKRRANESELETLRRLTHDDLAACYTVVQISYNGRQPRAEVTQWFMSETDGVGEFLDGCDTKCSAPPANCERK